MKMIKLPAKIAIALAQYYMDRDRQVKTSTEYVKGPDGKFQKVFLACEGKPWDKTASLKRISDACGNWGYSACAGTFWFSKPGVKHHIYEVDDNSWPMARINVTKRA